MALNDDFNQLKDYKEDFFKPYEIMVADICFISTASFSLYSLSW
jgi:hypothetical protein